VTTLLETDPATAEARVEVEVTSAAGVTTGWFALPHLLDSRPFESHFAVETENDGRALLRFGDGEHGLTPPEDSTMRASYWLGVGATGNIGADSLTHVIARGTLPEISQVRNPLAAWGGLDPEPLEQVKRLAPEAFQAETIRAVTEADYARAAEKHPEVAKAVATFRWTGSWHTVFVTVDRHAGLPVDAEFEQRLRAFLERSRLAGYDLEIDAPIFVPLEIEIDVCVASEHFRGAVEQALLEALSSGVRPDRTLGFFHPDNFTFGQPVLLSRLYAAIEAVQGVDGAEVRVFKRFHRLPAGELRRGFIPMSRMEIARLDNDPSQPENGVLRLNLWGGK
jgi:predicted phage baseplate assembly protein